MQSSTATLRDLINELITPDEERAWITWWTKHPADATEAKAFTEEQNVLFSQVQSLAGQGANPASPEAQRLVEEHHALLSRRGVWERTVRLLDWNSIITAKFYALWSEARSRQPARSSDLPQPSPILTPSATDFLAAARKASRHAQALSTILEQVKGLLKAHTVPVAPPSDEVVRGLRRVCTEHSLGNPYVLARCAPFLARVNRVEASPNEQAWEFLVRATLAREGHGAGL